jgi:hypothetical protein
VAIGARTRPHPSLNAILREVVITPDEIDTVGINTVGSVSITSRLRTVIDLLRFSDNFGDRESSAIATMMLDGALDYDACSNSLTARRNLPQKRIALQRLAYVCEIYPPATTN